MAFATAGASPGPGNWSLIKDERAPVMYAFAYVTSAKLGLIEKDQFGLLGTFYLIPAKLCFCVIMLLCAICANIAL